MNRYLKERIDWLDITSALAICLIVWGHSVETFYYIYQDRSILWPMLSTLSKLFDSLGMTVSRIGVPLFLFLIGAIIGSKQLDSERTVKRFYSHNYLHLIVQIELWILIWNLFLVFYQSIGGETGSVAIENIIDEMLLYKYVDTILPAQYIPTFLKVYLLLPIVAVGVHYADEHGWLKYPLAAAVVCFFGLPTFAVFTGRYVDVNLLLYFTYIAMGYYISKGHLREFTTTAVCVWVAIFSTISVFMQLYLYKAGIPYKQESYSLFILGAAIFVFEYLRRLECPKPLLAVCRVLSEHALEIFFVHNLIQYLIYHTGILSNMSRPIASTIMFTATIVLSCAVSVPLGFIKNTLTAKRS